MLAGKWLESTAPNERRAVVSKSAAEQLALEIGQSLTVTTKTDQYLQFEVIGIVEQPAGEGAQATRWSLNAPGATRGPAASAVYVPLAFAGIVNGPVAGRTNLVNIALQEGTTPDEFRAAWEARLASAQPPAMLFDAKVLEQNLESGSSGRGARRQAYVATALALMAGFFIIHATVSMGVTERIRQFAVLRAVALSARQIGLLIAVESMALALLGWLGGMLAGKGLLWAMAWSKPELMEGHASLGWMAIGLAAACSFGGALAASIIPAWRATRVSPLDAMSPPRYVRSTRVPLMAVIAGLLLIALNPC